ncbi:hypothetical protein [Nonomuraea solani]|uniref:hypothetical protein n=1 Tax=Nonomuraea solani TaxID=1144553 RepID=UPI00190E6CCC|nr:hypothetical protein [Nonomuraea solani]
MNVYRKERAISQPGGDVRWPSDVLPILAWGCGMYAAVDCRSSEATVLLIEPNGISDGWHRAWGVDSASLADWLETWIAGTGWYEEDTDDEVRPWEAARQRLSKG